MSISGLSKCERAIARDRAVHAMRLVLQHAAEVHYTQGPERWEGIAKQRVARKGEFPRHGDCSSTTSWALYNGLALPFHLGDVVNGMHWKAGFTGTQAQHGRQVMHLKNVLPADLVLYGSAPTFEHVAMIVGRRSDGKPLVISHGSEAGPFLLPFDYRSDHAAIRRYI